MKDFEVNVCESNEPPCTGLVFKGRVSTYFQKGVMGEKKYLNLMKRKSCGCPECSAILEGLKDYDFSCTYSWLNVVEDGELYTVKPTWESDYSYEEPWGASYLSEFELVKIENKR